MKRLIIILIFILTVSFHVVPQKIYTALAIYGNGKNIKAYNYNIQAESYNKAKYLFFNFIKTKYPPPNIYKLITFDMYEIKESNIIK